MNWLIRVGVAVSPVPTLQVRVVAMCARSCPSLRYVCLVGNGPLHATSQSYLRDLRAKVAAWTAMDHSAAGTRGGGGKATAKAAAQAAPQAAGLAEPEAVLWDDGEVGAKSVVI
jgi:hypothetical protein